MEQTKIQLRYPIMLEGVRVDTLTLRRPTVRDMLGVDDGKYSDAEKEVRLFAHLCEISLDGVMALDLADYTQLQQAYQDFLC